MMNNVPNAELNEVEFQIEKEDWNTYDLKGGVKIKGRIIAIKFVRANNMPPGQYGVQSQNIFSTTSPPDQKGVPGNPPPMDQFGPDRMYPVEVLNSNEVWNVYSIPSTGHRIKVKLVATEIFRVKDVYDQLGEPYHIITSGIMISPVTQGIST